jgi:predicted nucleic acid-binding protein
MTRDRFLLDTSFVLARINSGDKYHSRAMAYRGRMRTAAEVWVTEVVLVEIGDGASTTNRTDAIGFVKVCYDTPNIHVVTVDTALLRRAITLYENRPDKEWGLTDCISFIVMEDHGLTDALTADRHFVQAGFRALLLET